jgi:hypothetical protein
VYLSVRLRGITKSTVNYSRCPGWFFPNTSPTHSLKWLDQRVIFSWNQIAFQYSYIQIVYILPFRLPYHFDRTGVRAPEWRTRPSFRRPTSASCWGIGVRNVAESWMHFRSKSEYAATQPLGKLPFLRNCCNVLICGLCNDAVCSTEYRLKAPYFQYKPTTMNH